MPRPSLPPQARARGVTAVLGPTNTGKTHLAIERMLAHSSGMIGLPLRLLAREVYHRVVERVGADAVALVTGEEKIRPRHPRYWICTAEAMPRDLDLAFVGIDEIQLGADMDRGHTFTDRLLHQRGREETLLIGSSTMRPLVEALIPEVHVTTRPRLSTLAFAGEKKLSRLPPRTAIVAFSAEEVYAVAELIRRQRGGAAVVLGALSPRTRNAQVDLYQAGEVDYLVATDAVGMGLNLDVDHVAFAANRKYDGTRFRLLSPSELAQIAGRAGRHMRDGTFGTTGRCPPMEPEVVEALESHTFEPLRVLQWRNPDLRFESVAALQESLAEHPSERGLTRAPMGEDVAALESLARDTDIRDLARGRAAVERLWAVCGVPDYQKAGAQNHADLVSQLYRFLAKGMAGRIPAEWFAQHVAGVDRTDGDIDALSNRIAQVRTWTFVANRADWLADPEHWQAETRRVEDRLSDALHERLASRFVDRRTSVLMRRLRENAIMDAEITPTGDVTVEGQHVGHLHGFQFAPDPGAEGTEAKTLRNAAEKALAGEIEARAERFAATPDSTLVLSNDGTIRWTGDPVAKVIAGEKLMAPQIRVIADEQLTGPALEKVTGRLEAWLKAHIVRLLGPVMELESAAELTGLARGIAFQIAESLGVLERSRVVQEMRSLDQDGRANLRRHGVRFGAYHLYLPALLKPAPRTLATLLFALKHGGLDQKGPDELAHLAGSGRTSMAVDPDIAKGLYRAAGFRVCGNRAVRVDILERLADLIRPAIAYRPGVTPGEPPPGSADGETFVPTVSMTSLVGCSGEDFSSILKSLGYVMDRRAGPAITVPLLPMAAKVPAVQVAPEEAPAEDASAVADGASIEAEPSAHDGASAPEAAAEAAGDGAEAVVAATPEAEAVAEGAEPAADAPDSAAVSAVEAGLEAPTSPTVEADAEPAETLPAVAAEEAAPSGEATPSDPSDTAQAPASDEAATLAPERLAEGAPEEETAAAEPALIEVWRQHRHHRQAQPARGERVRHDGRNRGEARRGEGQGEPRRERHHGRGAASGQGAPGQAGAAGQGGAPGRDGGAPGREANGRGEARDGGRPGRPPRERREGGRPFEGRGAEGRGQEAREDRRPPRRERGPDPDSPFAKLLALKAQLESRDGGKR